MAANEWYYTVNGQQSTSPVSAAQLKQLAQAGQLQPTDLVWKDGLPNWVPASSLKGLFSASSAAAPRAPSMPPSFPEADDGADDYRPRSARGGGGGFGPGLMRAFAWNLSASTILPGEKAQLDAQGINGETAQRYLTWRRSFLFAVAVPTLIAAVLQTIQFFRILDAMKTAGKDVGSLISGFGWILEILYMASLFLLPAAALAGAFLWTRLKTTGFFLRVAWLFALVMPVVLVLMPATLMFSLPKSSMSGMSGVDDALKKEMEKAAAAMVAAMAAGLAVPLFFPQILPAIVSVAPGVVRAGLRLKTLVFGETAPGWAVVLGSYFCILVPFFIFYLAYLFLAQLSFLMLLSMILLLFAPVVYLVGSSFFVRPLSRRETGAVTLRQWIAFGMLAVGAIILSIYLLTSGSGSSEKAPPSARRGPPPGMGGKTEAKEESGTLNLILAGTQVYSDYLGRSLFTTVVFADFLLGSVVLAWRSRQQMAKTQDGANHEQSLTELAPLAGPARASSRRRSGGTDPGDFGADDGG